MLHSRPFDVLVIGAGPAGIVAACAASASGCRVGLLDDNCAPGGQVWRGERNRWLDRFHGCGAEYHAATRVIDHPSPGVILAETDDDAREFLYRTLILATGARERFLPFPGWTLPNVMGAGGLQALVKSGFPLEGRRVVVAGSGPLLPAVASHLRRHGAVIPVIAEQAPWRRLVRFGVSLAAHPGKAVQAFGMWPAPYRPGRWPLAAEGRERLEAVVLSDGKRRWREPCDYLACGFGLVPNTELAALAGCAVSDGAVRVNEWQETTQPGIYAAGEAVGIGGLDLAVATGGIAGHHAAGSLDKAGALFRARVRALRFKDRLDAAFALRGELRLLSAPETVVCRCEDVPIGRVRAHDSWNSAKLHTRCGMGPCQARVCGPAVEFLLGWKRDSVRPPVFPAQLGHLAAVHSNPQEGT
jgi:NADPH-dependent 2,4-dienoyl-CoA reductase/sulfur reductase-like enzyme